MRGKGGRIISSVPETFPAMKTGLVSSALAYWRSRSSQMFWVEISVANNGSSMNYLISLCSSQREVVRCVQIINITVIDDSLPNPTQCAHGFNSCKIVTRIVVYPEIFDFYRKGENALCTTCGIINYAAEAGQTLAVSMECQMNWS